MGPKPKVSLRKREILDTKKTYIEKCEEMQRKDNMETKDTKVLQKLEKRPRTNPLRTALYNTQQLILHILILNTYFTNFETT